MPQYIALDAVIKRSPISKWIAQYTINALIHARTHILTMSWDHVVRRIPTYTLMNRSLKDRREAKRRETNSNRPMQPFCWWNQSSIPLNWFIFRWMHCDFFLSAVVVCMCEYFLLHSFYYSIRIAYQTRSTCVSRFITYIYALWKRVKFDLIGHSKHMLDSIHKWMYHEVGKQGVAHIAP